MEDIRKIIKMKEKVLPIIEKLKSKLWITDEEVNLCGQVKKEYESQEIYSNALTKICRLY